MMKAMTTAAQPRKVLEPRFKVEKDGSPADTSSLAKQQRRFAHRIFAALAVLALGMIVNSILWLMGRAAEYQLLPATLLGTGLVYGVLWILE